MATPTPFTLTTALPPADLRFESMTHSSELSALEETQFQLLSEKSDLSPDKMLGQTVDLAVQLRDGKKRHFCGYVTRFGIGTNKGRWFGYQATVRPWLWFLTRTADCRVFQEQTVREIVEEVFKDHPIASYEFKLVRSYRKRTYCVQYRESDFNFVARLLEDEGIYWYFDHREGGHKLMLVDAPDAHKPIDGQAKLPYYDNTGQVPPDTETVSDWRFMRAVKSGKTVLASYDFERPSTKLKVEQVLQRDYKLSDYEVFDWQGDYTQKDDGQKLVEDRLDEWQCRLDLHSGKSNAHALAAGHTFDLARHPRADQNAQYLCTRLEVNARDQGSETAGSPGEMQCSFGAIRSNSQFRPPRRTRKPFMQGPQTAVVVGPSGEELFTDKYGRVKVQFHWDRYGKKDEKSSCWVRVSSPWAGKSFGFVQIPRITQEVVVDFLEGDPDQPLITGRVYNAEQMPPWELPANATQSGLLTRSSKGAAYSNANAIRFEDKKGSEQLWMHAEKNQDIEVENDETHWVGHDRKKTIDNDETTHVKHDRTETVDNNETITIHANRTETVDKEENITIHGGRTEKVDKDESITIDGARTETVAKDETITINGARTETVAKDETISINGGRTETVAKNETITINGGRTENVAKDESITIGGGRTENVAKDETVSISGGRTHSVTKDESVTISGGRTLSVTKDDSTTVSGGRKVSIGKDDALTVGKTLSITASDSITLTTGSASITMKKDGTITIKGKDITIDGSGKINAKASSDIVMKGSKILQN